MAEFLTIGSLEVFVSDTESPVETVAVIGDQARSFSGVLRSTVRAEKRVFGFMTGFLTEEELAELKTEVALGVTKTIGGTAMNGSIQGKVRIEEMPFQRDNNSHKRQARLLIEEV